MIVRPADPLSVAKALGDLSDDRTRARLGEGARRVAERQSGEGPTARAFSRIVEHTAGCGRRHNGGDE